jgi:ferredoxin-NADP reductase
MKPVQLIDKFLNNITMYRLLVYGLSLLLAGAILCSATGKLHIATPALLASSAVILTVCYIADRLLPILWEAYANNYSSLITGLILCCILPPVTSPHDLALEGAGALIAVGSKYIIARHHKHIFNPAALAALILGLTSLLPATWWIGSPVMLPFAVIFGLLVLRKVRRFQLFTSFLVASLFVATVLGLMHHQTITYILTTAFKSSPLMFLGTVMLTEPSTTPPGVWQQRIYGLLVGALFTSQLKFGFVSATPELALILGNVFTYLVSPKYKLRLKLKSKTRLAPHIYDFSFVGGHDLDFRPGQYLEWTLPRTKPDSRGNRRIFSIASAPGEEELHIATKTYEPGSSFKKELVDLRPGAVIVAGQLAGAFVLPKELDQKIVFIAGGIGITPFVSMAKDMIKRQQQRDIVLLYLVSNPTDLCYSRVWQQAEPFGLRVIPILTNADTEKTWQGLTGRLDEAMLQREVRDYAERQYYLSGPSAFVENYVGLLRHLKISHKRIITDRFSGY